MMKRFVWFIATITHLIATLKLFIFASNWCALQFQFISSSNYAVCSLSELLWLQFSRILRFGSNFSLLTVESFSLVASRTVTPRVHRPRCSSPLPTSSQHSFGYKWTKSKRTSGCYRVRQPTIRRFLSYGSREPRETNKNISRAKSTAATATSIQMHSLSLSLSRVTVSSAEKPFIYLKLGEKRAHSPEIVSSFAVFSNKNSPRTNARQINHAKSVLTRSNVN